MLGIIWTERWLGDGSAEMKQLLGFLGGPSGFFLWGYVKNIVCLVKINDLRNLKARIRDALATVTPNMLNRLYICRANKGAHI
jgi:hypothetical protein